MEKDKLNESVISDGYFNRTVQLDKAIELVGFGMFHYYLLFICGMLYVAVALSLTSVSFINPSAQCDFQLTSVEKGLLNGASMIGMFLGSFIWGYISDSRGRKYSLVYCMLMDGIFNMISSVSQVYLVFLFCRIVSGFGVSGSSILFSYLGEFLNDKYREKFLCWLEMFWTIGIILLPCIAWIIIPQTFIFESGYLLFRSWNLFAIICSLPSIIIACVLIIMPESPKFLLAKGKHEETIECLKYVHRWNNKTNHKFPVSSLALPDHINESSESFFRGLYENVIKLCTSKSQVVLVITCVIQFCVTASFYMMMLWFPELMNRLRWYEAMYTGPKNKTTMCEIISLYKGDPNDVVTCDDYIDESVYTNMIIVGIACIPTCIIVPLLVTKFGLRFFLVVTLFGSGASAACMYFITSSMENLMLSSVFEALSSTGFGLVFCIAVELFPTEYTGLAVSIGSMCGKLGSLVGNILIGVFIDSHCLVPLLISSSFLILSGFLVFTLPKTKRSSLVE